MEVRSNDELITPRVVRELPFVAKLSEFARVIIPAPSAAVDYYRSWVIMAPVVLLDLVQQILLLSVAAAELGVSSEVVLPPHSRILRLLCALSERYVFSCRVGE